MKELSIEEKAKRYDEAIVYAKKLLKTIGNATLGNLVLKNEFENMFNELVESEDERIRKELIEFVKSRLAGFPQCDKYLAWLEKQGEKKPAFEMKTPEESLSIDSETYSKIVDECIYGEQKPADKIEPKFKVGDRIRYKGHSCDGVITIITDTDYICGNAKLPISTQDKLELVEQKSAWTPMDEQRVENLLAIIEGHGYPGEVAWLKSLEGRVQSKQDEQKVAWSEEDDKMLKSIIINMENLQFSDDMREKYYHTSNANKSYYQIRIDWLKSFKERYTWKPSLSQLNALGVVAKGNAPDDIEEIKSLYNDLHKLIN